MSSPKRSRTELENWDRFSSSPHDRYTRMPPVVGISPKINKYEMDDRITRETMVTITFGLPGLQREDVTINVLHDKLSVRGDPVDPYLQEGACISREIKYEEFSRAVTIPFGMRPEDFNARMENGLLIVKYPKYSRRNEKPYCVPIE